MKQPAGSRKQLRTQFPLRFLLRPIFTQLQGRLQTEIGRTEIGQTVIDQTVIAPSFLLQGLGSINAREIGSRFLSSTSDCPRLLSRSDGWESQATGYPRVIFASLVDFEDTDRVRSKLHVILMQPTINSDRKKT